ncbi:hypothetical protein RN001_002129 [Aquatica leii]|uniref:cysteine dioxygenase n=1 Tax=Aquatica leii TaxID=1421715 RepID=A0AAN7QNB0_9COLE|nr:hypothetical protein RN001_002129 [Aquatica leii]
MQEWLREMERKQEDRQNRLLGGIEAVLNSLKEVIKSGSRSSSDRTEMDQQSSHMPINEPTTNDMLLTYNGDKDPRRLTLSARRNAMPVDELNPVARSPGPIGYAKEAEQSSSLGTDFATQLRSLVENAPTPPTKPTFNDHVGQHPVRFLGCFEAYAKTLSLTDDRMLEQGALPAIISLNDLVKELRLVFESNSVNIELVHYLMASYKSNPTDWKKYAKFDRYRYTRNLVDIGNGKYNLMVLCWGEGHGSAIHDHSNSHCFMKMLSGSLQEVRFSWPEEENKPLEETKRTTLLTNDVCYINDSMGLHRVENPSHVEGAVSLHLYCPPYKLDKMADVADKINEVQSPTFPTIAAVHSSMPSGSKVDQSVSFTSAHASQSSEMLSSIAALQAQLHNFSSKAFVVAKPLFKTWYKHSSIIHLENSISKPTKNKRKHLVPILDTRHDHHSQYDCLSKTRW